MPFGRIGGIVNFLAGRKGRTVFLFFGESTRAEGFHKLSGPCVELTPRIFRRQKAALEQLKDLSASDAHFEQTFGAVAASISELHENDGCGISSIELERSGSIEISFEGDVDDSEAQNIASQLFFFVRDVCHVHQHHARTSDTILDVVPFSGSDHEWKRETLYALYRWVIQQKRSRLPEAYVNAKGVLAYARAFSDIHCQDSKDEPTTSSAGSKLPDYHREATLESLEAGLEQSQIVAAERGRISTAIFNRFVPLVSILLAFLAMVYEPDAKLGVSNQELIVLKVTEAINNHILTFGGGVLLLSLLSNAGFVLRAKIFSRRFWFDFLRLMFPIKFWIVVTALAILAGGLTLLAIEVFFDLIAVPFEPGP